MMVDGGLFSNEARVDEAGSAIRAKPKLRPKGPSTVRADFGSHRSPVTARR